MDALDRVAGPALTLLTLVDTSLARNGAAADDPVWPLARRLRALPGDAVAAFVAVRPTPLVAAGTAIGPHLDRYAEAADALAVHRDWSGAAAQAYDAGRQALAARLVGGPDPGAVSHAGRLAATAAYAEATARWVSLSRAALARTLAEVLGSADAVTVTTGSRAGTGADGPGGPAGADAAARIAVPVLSVLVEIVEHGESLAAWWGPLLAPTDAAGPVDEAPVRPDGSIRLRY
ncbi:hypothetical protein O7608_06495 [Solwaraspora sp. WMMA2056]|uniref:hypothetical protein n=1 Tax=Solwaraspora sp. WMMA2056 TaxID=3015161 RepID=UPI00259BEDD8|nr:hypothetical protein [Solwaraspora sp. WMMA2056]WJK42040.1 hypothetical protein O7608_06495 [Solwaraspora sp. WMMA2056]